MAGKRYPELLKQKDIIRLLVVGIYKVDSETGKVYGHKGQEISPFPDKNGRPFVRLYWGGKRKAIMVGRLVWMARTLSPIPPNFEIHHDDENPQNNAWTNLYCLHELDHDKKHSDYSDLVPF